jgi:hypothetical protein
MSDSLASKLSDYDGQHSVSIERLKTLHHEHGLSLTDLSNRFNTSVKAISARMAKAGVDRYCGACDSVMSGVRKNINYCSKECEKIDSGVSVICPSCGDEISEIGRWVAHRDKKYGKQEILQKPSQYDGGKVNWRAQREKALQRANNKCEICDSEKELDVHHVMKRRYMESESRSHALSNLCVLCRGCHGEYENKGARKLYQAVFSDKNTDEWVEP